MMPAGPGGLGRCLFDRLDSGDRIAGEEGFGIEGESYPALLARVVPLRNLQRPLDALGLYCHLETGGAAAHLDRDSYHLPASLVSAPTAQQSKPFLLQHDNKRINKRRQFVESHNRRRSTAIGRTSEKEHLCSRGFARVPLTKRDPDLVFQGGAVLVFCTARRREAADTHLFPGGIDPQEVLEQRRLVPVEELREAVVDGTASAARQRKDPLGHTTDALADVDPGPRAAPVRSRVAWPCTRPPRQALSRAILCRRRAGGHTACCRNPQSRVADEVVLGDALQMHLRYPVRGARVGTPAPTDDVVERCLSSTHSHAITLVVVDISPDGRDVVVLGVAHYLVYRAAALDRPAVVLVV